MRIAQVVSVFPPYKGGTGNVAYNYSKELVNLGHEVTVFVPKYYNVVPGRNDHFKTERIPPMLASGNAAFIPHLYFKLKKFDIINLHYPFFGGCEATLLQKVIHRKQKLVVSYHLDSIALNVFRKVVFGFYNKFIVPQIIKKADCILVSSLDYARHSQIASWYQATPEKFQELPYGVDPCMFYPRHIPEATYQKYHINPKEKVIVFVGGLASTHYFKGVSYLIQAFARVIKKIKDVRLVLVGKGNLQATMEELSLSLGLNENVSIINTATDEDLTNLLNIARVLVLPSINQAEAFGIVLIEAMACATPVIASNLPGVRTVVDNGVNGFLVPPKDIEALAEKIEKILQDEVQSRRFGENGRKKVQETYLWPSIASTLENIYYETIRGS